MGFPSIVFLTVFVIVILASSQCQGCNQTLRQSNGTFTSPGYPRSYPNRAFCSWAIETDLKHVITLNFRDLQLETCGNCGCDSVSVFDGNDSTNLLLGRYCCPNAPYSIRSTGNTMYVVFKADGSVSRKGFSAVYKSQECKKGLYGTSCTQECSQGCANNDCNTTTETCTYGCKDGYTGVKCDECSEGKYGPICTQACSEGCSDNNCDRVTGNCLGGCSDGYTGDTCNECVDGKYGLSCTLSCAINCNSGQCQRDTGYCTRCLDGYYGNFCENKISEDSSASLGKGIGIGAGAMFVVDIIIAVVGVCCYRRSLIRAGRRQELQVYDMTKMDGQEEHSYKKMYTSDNTRNPPTDAPSEDVYLNTNEETNRQPTQSANENDNLYEEVTVMATMKGTRGHHPGGTNEIRNTTVSTAGNGDEVYVNAGHDKVI